MSSFFYKRPPIFQARSSFKQYVRGLVRGDSFVLIIIFVSIFIVFSFFLIKFTFDYVRDSSIHHPIRADDVFLTSSIHAEKEEPHRTTKAQAVYFYGDFLRDPNLFLASVYLSPPYVVVDSMNFSSGSKKIMLGGVQGPAATSVCEDEKGGLWACGLQARSALHALLKQEDTRCDPFVLADWFYHLAYLSDFKRCFVREEEDVAVGMVRAGFARPIGLLSSEMLDALNEAQENTRGLWNGNWKIVR